MDETHECATEICSKTEIAQPRVIVGTPSEWPMVFAIGFLDWKIIDARDALLHQALDAND